MTIAANPAGLAAACVALAVHVQCAAALDAATQSTLWSLQSNVLSYFILILPAALLVRYYQRHPERALGQIAGGGQWVQQRQPRRSGGMERNAEMN